MSMDRHRCKLCCKIFSNGRALGGHMRSHLASFPIPLKKNALLTESDSSSTHELEDEFAFEEKNEKLGTSYELRENPKRSVKAVDPEFLDAGSVVVQDRESETESTQPNNPTRRRSKRPSQARRLVQLGYVELVESCKKLKSESCTESVPVSSVSDASRHTDEEGALCLMMLSRDVWVKEVASKELSVEDTNDSEELKHVPVARASTRPAARAAKFKCMSCKKVFRTGRALAGHKASNRGCCTQVESENNCSVQDHKIYKCPFCYKVFGSGQALGGHKRSHLAATATNNVVFASSNTSVDVIVSPIGDKVVGDDTMSFVLDLNLPAPLEDDYEEQLDFEQPTC